MSSVHIRKLVDYIECTMSPADTELGYHPTEIEAALIEGAFTARATYGSPTTGVRRVLTRWRGQRGAALLDDLNHLAVFAKDPEHLVSVFGNRQRVPGNHVTKAEAVASAARSLASLGCACVSDLVDTDDPAPYRTAFESIPGFGRRTWENVTMHAGKVTAESEAALVDYVSDAVEQLSSADTRSLISATAHRLSIPAKQLEYGIWRCQRERQREADRAARAARSA